MFFPLFLRIFFIKSDWFTQNAFDQGGLRGPPGLPGIPGEKVRLALFQLTCAVEIQCTMSTIFPIEV